MHKGQRVAFSLCPCASSLKCPNPQVVVVLAPATPTAPVALSLSPVLLLLFLPVLSLPQLQLANYEKRNLITTANEQMQLAAHAAAYNMQQLATCSVRCVCAVFASCLCQILWPKGAFEMKSTGNCNCPKIFDALLMRLAMLHYLPREGQLNLLTHTHTHTCIGLPQGSLGWQRGGGWGRPN